MNTNLPLHQIYSQRDNFVIVALTGITGSGCSKFADLMSKNFQQWHEGGLLRPYKDELKIWEETLKGGEA